MVNDTIQFENMTKDRVMVYSKLEGAIMDLGPYAVSREYYPKELTTPEVQTALRFNLKKGVLTVFTGKSKVKGMQIPEFLTISGNDPRDPDAAKRYGVTPQPLQPEGIMSVPMNANTSVIRTSKDIPGLAPVDTSNVKQVNQVQAIGSPLTRQGAVYATAPGGPSAESEAGEVILPEAARGALDADQFSTFIQQGNKKTVDGGSEIGFEDLVAKASQKANLTAAELVTSFEEAEAVSNTAPEGNKINKPAKKTKLDASIKPAKEAVALSKEALALMQENFTTQKVTISKCTDLDLLNELVALNIKCSPVAQTRLDALAEKE